ncbi:LacI family DNA-binding transcriptional regulator [Octadecabacter sp. G9-8]|uniref:LacI family DNA-binding transcriptional regulator n=1 Tax=Octadecabacter dasysiphoniae TaxID=2909341 RepID=A0ABS9CYZ9_9RHOB|nr:LacI family DNA-binding transcriptional regulator [Octadecabacter dasysiphoniae]MCF2872419.1 LacI family DNA-binding transcriptional regulator [Octadecabacter dasysiphoniae]
MTTSFSIPTLDDVARAAGVSTATVSRCLNAEQKVSKDTRDRVMEAVDALGYTPNFNARAMAAKRTYTIGAIIPTMENAIFARGLQAFQETLHGLGYNLLVSSSAYRPELEAEQIRGLVARGADGLLLIGYEREQSVYDYLGKRGIPTMLAWSYLPDRPHASVGFDNRASMRVLADRVISMGHRRVAVISGIVDGNDRAEGRLNGIKDSWVANGFDLADLPVIETPYEIENGATAFETLMNGTQKPSVIMCGNDVLAAGAMTRAKELGYDIPNDVSVTGFDDIELAKHLHPSLTTVHVPHREMGRTAARELVNLIDGSSTTVHRQLNVSIIMRNSLAQV